MEKKRKKIYEYIVNLVARKRKHLNMELNYCLDYQFGYYFNTDKTKRMNYLEFIYDMEIENTKTMKKTKKKHVFL
jgi:hypothetical protein